MTRTRPFPVGFLVGLTIGLVTGCTGPVTPSMSASPSATAFPSPSPPTSWVAAARPVTEMSAGDRAAIDAAATDALASVGDGATALYVGLWDPLRGVYLRAYGESSPGVPATLGDHNRIGSVTKTFTAVAVLQLVAQGRIALSDTLAMLLPGLVAEFPAIAPFTVDQLLGMRTGIGDFFCCPNTFTETFYADHAHEFSVADLVSVGLQMHAPPPEPLSSSDYSNTNYVILGEILRVATGRPANEVITELARSAGLAGSGLGAPDEREMPQPAAHGYLGPRFIAEHHDLLPASVVPVADASDWTLSAGGPAGGMYSTVEDLGAWAASGYGSALLPLGLANARLTTPSGADWDYGYGIIRVGDWLGHGGSVDGWLIDSAFNTATGATWVLIVNSSGGEGVLQALGAFLPDPPY